MIACVAEGSRDFIVRVISREVIRDTDKGGKEREDDENLNLESDQRHVWLVHDVTQILQLL